MPASFDGKVKPFLAKHCFSCHDARKAKAGFRIDRLGLDFLAGNTADEWKEVMDHINLGDMPPEDEPRPDSKESFAVVKWIAGELRKAEKAARLKSGRTPMRRLNRDEYANTIRDLLKMDAKVVAPLVEDLPGDGKAEGFDRLGVALFVDATQIEQSLKAAERIAAKAVVDEGPPAKRRLRWEPETAMEFAGESLDFSSISGVKGHRIPHGPAAATRKENGAEWIYGVGEIVGEGRSDWQRLAWQAPDLSPIVIEDGWYRVSIRAGMAVGERSRPVKMRLDYAAGTSAHATVEFQLQAPLSIPQRQSRAMFLRKNQAAQLVPYWNPHRGLMRRVSTCNQLRSRVMESEQRLNRWLTKSDSEKALKRYREALSEARAEAAKYQGPAFEFHPTMNRDDPPRLFLDYLQVEGPFPSETSASQADEPVTMLGRYEAENERHLGIRRESKLVKNRFNGKLKVENGLFKHWPHKDGMMLVQGGPVYEKGATVGRLGRLDATDRIPEDGYYRIRFRGGADRGFPNQPITVKIRYGGKLPIETWAEIPVTASTDDPNVHETTMFLLRGGHDIKRRLEFFWNDERRYIVTADFSNEMFRAINGTVNALSKGRAAGTLSSSEEKELQSKLADARKRADEWKGPAMVINPKFKGRKPPRFYLDWVEIEGPIREEWPPLSHRQLVFAGNTRNDAVYLKEIFERFLPRAYRRPVSADEISQVAGIATQRLNAGASFADAVRTGLQRALISPGFLFLQEPAAKPRRLNDYELASRLSYFVWSTMPDDRLFELAAANRLHQPAVLKAELQRLLADPKSREFVENFAGQWLSVREFGSVMPARQYEDYDAELEQASKQEAFAFFKEILANNLPITSFLDSDFLVINERLARHYDIDGVQGKHFRRVALAPRHHRGGIFGMAGLMTLLADGTRTLPVRRAAWIRENIFNDPPPPPPPNAGEVQPNTSGEKLTVRERLERHRNEPTCASCHAPLDPYGLALENYDAIGKWRTHQNGENFKGRKRPELNVSGQLPSGRQFSSLEEFKSALLAEKDAFARAFSERLLTYALTRPVGYVDHKAVDQLVTTLQKNEYRIRPLIEAVVLSEVFQTK